MHTSTAVDTYLGSDALVRHDLEPLERLVSIPDPGAGGDSSRVARRVGDHPCISFQLFFRAPTTAVTRDEEPRRSCSSNRAAAAWREGKEKS